MDQAPRKKRGHEKMSRLVLVANRGQGGYTGSCCWAVPFLQQSCFVQYALCNGLPVSLQFKEGFARVASKRVAGVVRSTTVVHVGDKAVLVIVL